jgi:hypothetical protein
VARYAFHDLTLEVEPGEKDTGKDLDQLLHELSWVKTQTSAGVPSLSVFVRLNDHDGLNFPLSAREVLRADGFRGLEDGSDFYLTDGASLLYLQAARGRGEARLAPSFFRKPPRLQQDFWLFALMKLLRPMGIYGLHAAGLVAESGLGLLVVGESGSGKSTLAIGLIRRGWRYLSDDAVLLRSRPSGVEALALRRHFYVDSAAAGQYEDLALGEEKPDRQGGRRKRIGIEARFSAQRADACTPRVLLFPRIVPREQSALIPLDRAAALGRLMAQSGSQLFDRDTMQHHLTVLKTLLEQAMAYELEAGSDLHRDPAGLTHLIAQAQGGTQCLASS